jgi:hypothetical protein
VLARPARRPSPQPAKPQVPEPTPLSRHRPAQDRRLDDDYVVR